MDFRKILRKGLNIFFVFVFVTAIGYFVASYFFDIKFIYPYIVQSGSMEPQIKTGSLVFSYPTNSYNPGDVITFSNGSADNLVTHRVEFKLYPDGIENGPVYLTSGDANDNFDRWEVTQANIVGKVIFTVPYLGYAADFAKKPQGFILLVIIPATIIIYEELKILGREITAFLKRIREEIRIKVFIPKKDKSPDVLPKKEPARTYIDIDERTVNLSPKAGLKKSSVLLPLIGSAFVLVSLSAAFFSDTELSTGNVFQASDQFGPSNAQTLVINEVLPDTDCFQGNTEAQWIELYNGFDFAINPKDFKITDGTNTIDLVTANNLSIPAGGFLLLAHNSAIWGQNGCWNNNGIQTGNLGGQLNIDVGVLELIDTDGTTVIDHVQWNGQEDAIPGQNESIERVPLGLDSALGSNWEPTDFIVRELPTPGI